MLPKTACTDNADLLYGKVGAIAPENHHASKEKTLCRGLVVLFLLRHRNILRKTPANLGAIVNMVFPHALRHLSRFTGADSLALGCWLESMHVEDRGTALVFSVTGREPHLDASTLRLKSAGWCKVHPRPT